MPPNPTDTSHPSRREIVLALVSVLGLMSFLIASVWLVFDSSKQTPVRTAASSSNDRRMVAASESAQAIDPGTCLCDLSVVMEDGCVPPTVATCTSQLTCECLETSATATPPAHETPPPLDPPTETPTPSPTSDPGPRSTETPTPTGSLEGALDVQKDFATYTDVSGTSYATYTIMIANPAPAGTSLSNIVLDDVVSEGSVIESVIFTPGVAIEGPASGTQTIKFHIAWLPGGTAEGVSISVRLADSQQLCPGSNYVEARQYTTGDPLPTPLITQTALPTGSVLCGVATPTPSPSSVPRSLTCSQCDMDLDGRVEHTAPTSDDLDFITACLGQPAGNDPCSRANLDPLGTTINSGDVNTFVTYCTNVYPNNQSCSSDTPTPTQSILPTATSTPTPSPTITPTGTLTPPASPSPTPLLSHIGDYVWEDSNDNGLQDDGESPVAGAYVQLLNCTENTVALRTAMTDTTGRYDFGELGAGCYRVKFYPLSGYLVCTRQHADPDHTDRDSDPGSDWITQQIQLSANVRDTSIDACMRKAVSETDLSLTKSVSAREAEIGDEVVFTLTVRNEGARDATNVKVKEYLPASLSFVSASPVESPSGTYDAGDHIWNIGTLGGGVTRQLRITARVMSGNNLTNTAEIYSMGERDIDSVPNNGNLSEDDYASITLTTTRVSGSGAEDTQLADTGVASVLAFGIGSSLLIAAIAIEEMRSRVGVLDEDID